MCVIRLGTHIFSVNIIIPVINHTLYMRVFDYLWGIIRNILLSGLQNSGYTHNDIIIII